MSQLVYIYACECVMITNNILLFFIYSVNYLSKMRMPNLNISRPNPRYKKNMESIFNIPVRFRSFFYSKIPPA